MEFEKKEKKSPQSAGDTKNGVGRREVGLQLGSSRWSVPFQDSE